MPTLKFIAVLLFGLFSINCSAEALIQDITSNTEAYFQEHFSRSTIREDVLAQIIQDKSPPLFQKITIQFESDYETNGKKQNVGLKAIFTDLGNGIVMCQREASSNGIPTYLQLEATYRGFIILRSQPAFFDRAQAQPLAEIKEFKKFNPLTPDIKPDEEYEVEFLTGLESQLFNYNEIKYRCKSGPSYPAQQLHPKFAGNATDLKCIQFRNGIKRKDQIFTFLHQYGIAMTKENISSGSTDNRKIIDVTIQ